MRSFSTTIRRSVAVAAVGVLLLGACAGSESGDTPADQVASVDDTSVDDTSAGDTSIDGEDPDGSDENASPTDEQADTSAAPTTAPSTTTPPPTTVPRQSLPIVEVDPDTGEPVDVEVVAPGPTTLDAVADFGVAAGIWDEVEGLTRVLRYATGGLDAAQVPGVEDVITGELGGALTRANALAVSGDYTDDELADLRAAYEAIVPSAETRAALASGAVSGFAGQGFAGAPNAVPDGCDPVDPADFDGDLWVVGCYRSIEQSLPDAELRVLYPAWWEEDGNMASVPSLTMEALVTSVETFRSLGQVGDAEVLFSAVDTTTGDFLASAGVTAQWGMESVAGCPVSVLPRSLDTDLDKFQQTIAHEYWHCVQHYEGYPAGVTSGTAWYREGGAEFFSNVAYPSANDEHGWIDTFDRGLETSLNDMSYEAWIFWQHFANEVGVKATADLHKQMMEVGSSHVQLMQPYDQLFHDFTVDFVAGVIQDQNGSALPRARMFQVFPPVTKDSAGTSLKLELLPFAATRWHASYAEQLRILQTDASVSALNSMVKWEERRDRPSWQGVYPEVRSKCDSASRYAGVTTNVSQPQTLEITIDTVEEASCDPCLLGTWSLDLETFQAMILGAMEAEGQGLPPGTTFEFGGAYYIAFQEDSVVLEQRDGLEIRAALANVGGLTTIINSFATGQYTADGERIVITNLVESFNEVIIDTPFGGGGSFPSDIAEGLGSYTCNDDTLEVVVDGFTGVTWYRVDKILTPPDSPADAETSGPSDS